MNCKNCDAPVPAGATQCPRCGSSLPRVPVAAPSSQPLPSSQVQVVIQTGGASTPAAAQPQAVPMPAAPPKPRSKIVAGVLGILLGGIGVHRFYLGYNHIGVAQLLIAVCTCGYGLIITGIWGLIEGIMILTGKIDKDAQGQPLTD